MGSLDPYSVVVSNGILRDDGCPGHNEARLGLAQIFVLVPDVETVAEQDRIRSVHAGARDRLGKVISRLVSRAHIV